MQNYQASVRKTREQAGSGKALKFRPDPAGREHKALGHLRFRVLANSPNKRGRPAEQDITVSRAS